MDRSSGTFVRRLKAFGYPELEVPVAQQSTRAIGGNIQEVEAPVTKCQLEQLGKDAKGNGKKEAITRHAQFSAAEPVAFDTTGDAQVAEHGEHGGMDQLIESRDRSGFDAIRGQ